MRINRQWVTELSSKDFLPSNIDVLLTISETSSIPIAGNGSLDEISKHFHRQFDFVVIYSNFCEQTMSKNVNVFQTLLYTIETSIYYFVHKVLENVYTYIFKSNSQFISKNFLSQSILCGSNVLLNYIIPKKYLNRNLIFRLKPKKTLSIIYNIIFRTGIISTLNNNICNVR